jgi:GNAT superfamily N-acetyltransferase
MGAVVIRDAGAAELPVLQGIDVATGQMFRDIGMPEVAEYDPWPLPDLEHSRAAGLLWVIAGEPVAFLMGSQVDGCLHVEQLSVDMGSARRGLGRTLLEHAARRAAADGRPALTLTTFEHVPWNAPYYASARVPDPGRRRGHPRGCADQAAGGRDRPGPMAAGVHAPRRPGLARRAGNHPACCLTAVSRAGSGSQPSCDQVILPDAETRANQGWSWTW